MCPSLGKNGGRLKTPPKMHIFNMGVNGKYQNYDINEEISTLIRLRICVFTQLIWLKKQLKFTG